MYTYQRELLWKGDYDVIVAGGGPAGVTAAVAAARLGARVLLVEQTNCLGGIGSNGLVLLMVPMTDQRELLVRGLGEEVIRRLRARHGTGPADQPDNWQLIPIQPEALKLVYDEMVSEAGVHVRFHTSVIDVVREGSSVTGLVLAGRSGAYAAKGRMFVDATGDAALTVMAGAPWVLGDEHGQTQGMTLCFLLSGIDWPSHNRFLHETGQDASLAKTLRAAIAEGAFSKPDLHLPGVFHIGQTLGMANAGHVHGRNGVDDTDLTEALFEGRRTAQEYVRFYQQYVPGFEQAELAVTGSLMGVRETRRIVGDYVLTVEDFRNQASFVDEIGRYAYPVDLHRPCPSQEEYEQFEQEFYQHLRYGPGESYGIPYRSLLPQGLGNVLVAGRCISADRGMQGSTRVQPGCYLTGQAAGTAAAMCAQKSIHTRALDTTELRHQLRSDGAYLP